MKLYCFTDINTNQVYYICASGLAIAIETFEINHGLSFVTITPNIFHNRWELLEHSDTIGDITFCITYYVITPGELLQERIQ